MTPDIIVLEAVYDNSDMMTDYFDADHPLERWFIADFAGKAVTEQRLRAVLGLLPAWLQAFNWQFRRGKKYSMSDHPYGQLRVDKGTGLTIVNGIGLTVGMSFIVTVSWKDTFTMNDSVDAPIPQSREEVAGLIAKRDAEIKERKAKYEAMRQARAAMGTALA